MSDPPWLTTRDLADRIRELIAADGGIAERRMFGGLAFLIDGHMAVAVSGQGGLMVPVNPAEAVRLCARPHTRPFEMRGVEMTGWLRVDGEGLRTKRQLEPWVRRGVAYARSLPPKSRTQAPGPAHLYASGFVCRRGSAFVTAEPPPPPNVRARRWCGCPQTPGGWDHARGAVLRCLPAVVLGILRVESACAFWSAAQVSPAARRHPGTVDRNSPGTATALCSVRMFCSPDSRRRQSLDRHGG